MALGNWDLTPYDQLPPGAEEDDLPLTPKDIEILEGKWRQMVLETGPSQRRRRLHALHRLKPAPNPVCLATPPRSGAVLYPPSPRPVGASEEFPLKRFEDSPIVKIAGASIFSSKLNHKIFPFISHLRNKGEY